MESRFRSQTNGNSLELMSPTSAFRFELSKVSFGYIFVWLWGCPTREWKWNRTKIYIQKILIKWAILKFNLGICFCGIWNTTLTVLIVRVFFFCFFTYNRNKLSQPMFLTVSSIKFTYIDYTKLNFKKEKIIKQIKHIKKN